MTTFGFCILCRATTPNASNGRATLCGACLREKCSSLVRCSEDEAGRVAAASRRMGSACSSQERGRPSAARPVLVEVIGALVVVALPPLLWFIAAL